MSQHARAARALARTNSKTTSHRETTVSLRNTCLALVAVAATAPASAEMLDVSFTGTVSNDFGTTANSGYADGDSITGSFLYNTVTDTVTGATLGSFVAPASSGANSATTPNLSSTDATFVQGLFASAGDPVNQSIHIDFSALTNFTGSDLGAFLLQPSLAQQIDFTGAASIAPSFATYVSATATGDNITSVGAYLNSVSVSPVPLPAAFWLFGSAAAALFSAARRRVAR
jgi:hypothetical protein